MTDRNRRVGRRDRVAERQAEEDPVTSEVEEVKPPRRHNKEHKEHSRRHKKEKETRHRKEPEEEEDVELETEPVEVERESEVQQEEPSAQEVSENNQQEEEEDNDVKITSSVEEEEESSDKKKKKKTPPVVYSNVIGKASEKDLNILKNIAKGVPRFQHVYGTRDYADIVLVDKDKKEHYLSAIMLSSVIPRTLIADIMECREERDNLCVVRLPISNVATEILVKYAYQIPIASVVAQLDLATKKRVIGEFDEIQALPIISELYRDKELISIGDPKSIATWITTCATSNVSLAGGQLPEITPQILRYLDGTVVAIICKVMPADDEIGIKLAWCCARETEPDGKTQEELINESQVLLQGISPTAKLPSLDKLTNMLHQTVNPVVYRFILNKSLNTKLPLKPGPVNVPHVEKKLGDKVATPNKKGKSPGKITKQ